MTRLDLRDQLAVNEWVRRGLSMLRIRVRRVYFAVRFAGAAITVHPSAYVSRRSVIRVCGGGSISIGERCEIHDYAMLLTYGGHIALGHHCSVNPFTIVYGHGGTSI